MKKSEKLEEGWVNFSRFNCTEGCIDIWMGDCADNPNRDTKSRWNLNAFATFIRLDGKGEWYPNTFRKGVNGFTAEMSEVSTSQEIWEELTKNNHE